MVGIYLSGTGNTKYCIEKLVSLIHSSAKAIPMESPEAISAIQQNEEIYIGYPTQFSNAPYMVRDFIKKNADIWKNKKILCIATMGAFSGDGAGCTTRMLKRYGATILGGIHIHMPDSVCDSKLLKKTMEADYKTNLNYKSSGWFFLCNLYKNGKTRKRCKRMNDSAFLNSRRTGIFKDMSNGTICIPKDLRDNNGLEKNDRVELIPMQEGIYIRKAYGEKKCQ